MSEPFIGEIRMFASNFAPIGWELCQGQLLPIAQNNALFALLGTTFGGNGTTTFALPDLRGRVPMHPSSTSQQGTAAGLETVTLTLAQMPAHNHLVATTTATGTLDSFENARFATASDSANIYAEGGSQQTLNPGSVSTSGSSQAHLNCQPSLVGNFCIATRGVFPSRN